MKKPPRDGLGFQKAKRPTGVDRSSVLKALRRGLGFQKVQRKGAREIGIGAAPSMGELPRMHKNALFKLPARYVTTIAMILFGGTCMLFGGAMTGVLLWWLGGIDSPRLNRPLLPSRSVASYGLPADPLELERNVTKLLAARSPAEIAPLIRGSNQRPEEIVARLANLEKVDGKVRSVRYLRSIDSRCLRLESVLVTFVTGHNRLALLSPDEQKQWRVDFDGFDRYVSPSWEKLLAGEAKQGVVRVQVIPDNYYNGPYGDDQAWVCFALPSPDHDQMIFGYTPRGSRQHAAIATILSRGDIRWQGGIQRMMLELRRTGEGDRRQFEITRVLSDEWALGDKPLDELIGDPSGG